jgi:hypothetical protein
MGTEAKKYNTYRVAAAIDFGTHGTGYAWVPMDTQNDDPVHREIRFRDGWPYQPVKGPKPRSTGRCLVPLSLRFSVSGLFSGVVFIAAHLFCGLSVAPGPGTWVQGGRGPWRG